MEIRIMNLSDKEFEHLYWFLVHVCEQDPEIADDKDDVNYTTVLQIISHCCPLLVEADIHQMANAVRQLLLVANWDTN